MNGVAIVLVCGPPCSGKSTFVASAARPGDLVVDHDLLAQEAGSPVSHNHDAQYRDAAEEDVARLLDEIADGKHPSAWVIRAAADTHRRDELARYIRTDDVRVITDDRAVLIARAQDRPDPIATVRAINRWFEVASPKTQRRHPAWSR